MMLPPSKTEHDDCEDNVMALSLVGGSTIAKRLTQSKMCRLQILCHIIGEDTILCSLDKRVYYEDEMVLPSGGPVCANVLDIIVLCIMCVAQLSISGMLL